MDLLFGVWKITSINILRLPPEGDLLYRLNCISLLIHQLLVITSCIFAMEKMYLNWLLRLYLNHRRERKLQCKYINLVYKFLYTIVYKYKSCKQF